jgi:hypothetical protein
MIFGHLLYKAQVTGYMLWNAEKRVHQALLAPPSEAAYSAQNNLLPQSQESPAEAFKYTGTVRITTRVRIECPRATLPWGHKEAAYMRVRHALS